MLPGATHRLASASRQALLAASASSQVPHTLPPCSDAELFVACLQIHLAQATTPDEMWVMWSSGDYFTGPVDTAALGQAAADAQPKPRCYYSKRSGGPYKVKKG